MKKNICFIFCLLFSIFAFSQDLLDDIWPWLSFAGRIQVYQNKVKLWINQNNIHTEYRTLMYNGIELFTSPNINPTFPEGGAFSRGAGGMDSIAMGKFLTISENEEIYSVAYSSISNDIKQNFLPFMTFETFKNSIIFNPNIVFASEASKYFFGSENNNLNSIFHGDSAYLIFHFGSYLISHSEPYDAYSYFGENVHQYGNYAILFGDRIWHFGSSYGDDVLFDHQLNQLANGANKDIIIFPNYNIFYAVFKIDNTGNIELLMYRYVEGAQ